jgi:biopolymer transport protein ExbB
MLTETPARRRWMAAAIALLAALVAFGTVTATPTAAVAQENEAAGGDDAAAGGGEGAEGGENAAEAPQESFLMWTIRASGIFGLLIAIMSFIMVALVVMIALHVRRDVLMPPAFIEEFEQRLTAKDYQGAYEVAKSDDSFVARVLAAGLSRLNRGYEEAVEGMQEVGEEENMALDHRMNYLSLIGTLGPLMGLAGTVQGMIMSFRVIANSTASPKPKDLADGISTALFTTIEGLAVAIPAILFYGILRNRQQRLVLEVGMVSDSLMSRFSTVGKKAAASGGGAAQPAPAAPQQQP